MFGEKGLRDGAIGFAGLPSVDDAKHLLQPPAPLRCHAIVGRGWRSTQSSPEPGQRRETVECVLVERNDGGQRDARR